MDSLNYKELYDLDFFTHNSARFGFAVRNIKIKLREKYQVDTEVDSRNFIRIKVDKKLQVDFVNDTAYRYKDPVVKENGIIIDTIENILSNKLTAVIGRDNPKDIFDIYLICTFYDFSWKEIVESAQKKASFMFEDLIARLKSFPFPLLKTLQLADSGFLDDFEKEFPLIIKEITRMENHKKIMSL